MVQLLLNKRNSKGPHYKQTEYPKKIKFIKQPHIFKELIRKERRYKKKIFILVQLLLNKIERNSKGPNYKQTEYTKTIFN